MLKGKLYSEIFDEFVKAPNRQSKIEVLQKYDDPRFREFLYYLFNQNVKFDVTLPGYRPAVEPAGLNYSYLQVEMPKMYRFIQNHPRRAESPVTPQKQQQLFTIVLEALHKDEAELLIRLIKKDLRIDDLTTNIVKEAFPSINI